MTKIEFCEHDGKLVRTAEIPSTWDEMTAEQVRFVFRTYDRYATGLISALQMNMEILFHLLGMKMKSVVRYAEDDRTCQNIWSLCEKSLAFLFEQKGEDEILGITFKSIQNPMPTVRIGMARSLLTGPASLLQDLTFGEFRHASTALNAFFRSSDISDLDECIAFLYRRKSMKANRAGRFVKPFSEEAIRDAGKIQPWQKTLIMMWLSSCVNYLQTGSLTLNGEQVDLALLFSGDSSDKGPVFTWNDLLVQIARDQTIGNIDRVDEEPLFSIIALMWTNYKENKRYERSAKSGKNK